MFGYHTGGVTGARRFGRCLPCAIGCGLTHSSRLLCKGLSTVQRRGIGAGLCRNGCSQDRVACALLDTVQDSTWQPQLCRKPGKCGAGSAAWFCRRRLSVLDTRGMAPSTKTAALLMDGETIVSAYKTQKGAGMRLHGHLALSSVTESGWTAFRRLTHSSCKSEDLIVSNGHDAAAQP